MTNLDVICTVLSEVTGRTPAHWRDVLHTTLATANVDIAKSEMLTRLSRAESKQLLRKLRREKAGILAWVLAGAVRAQTLPPATTRQFEMRLGNRQN